MVQVIPQLGSFASQAGRAISQGAQEGFTPEFKEGLKRSRLSEGLKQLQADKNLTPLERIAKLHSIQGMTPEIANQVAPLLRSQSIIDEQSRQQMPMQSQGRVSPRGGLTQNNEPTSQGYISPGVKNMSKTPNWLKDFEISDEQISSPESAQLLLKNPPNPTVDEINQRAVELTSQSPNLYPTFESGVAGAEREAAVAQKEYENTVNRRTRELSLIESANTNLQRKLQMKFNGKPILDSLNGEILSKIEDKMQSAIITDKLSPEKAAKIFGDIGLEIAKGETILKNKFGGLNMFSPLSENESRDLKNLAKIYRDLGEEEYFRNTYVANTGVSDHRAAELVSPPSKDISSALSKVNKDMSPSFISKVVGESIDKNDSLFTIGKKLHDMNINDQRVMDNLAEQLQNGKISLSPRQKRELLEYYPSTKTLGEMFTSFFKGNSFKKYEGDKQTELTRFGTRKRSI